MSAISWFLIVVGLITVIALVWFERNHRNFESRSRDGTLASDEDRAGKGRVASRQPGLWSYGPELLLSAGILLVIAALITTTLA